MSSAARTDLSDGVTDGRLGMWVFLVADAVSFAALLIAGVALRARSGAPSDPWPDAAARFDVPLAAGLTFALLASSTTMAFAVDAAGAGRAPAARRWLWGTVALGLVFVGGQALEWAALRRHGVGVASDLQAASFFATTGWHGAHVVAGVVALVALGLRRAVAAETLAVAALFWHFLDAAWIVIFTVGYLA
jgi:heme/copper-type cytochrome/quinol oxidase subunit 3